VKTAAERARKQGQSLARKPAAKKAVGRAKKAVGRAKKAVGRAKKAVTGARQKAKALGTKIAGKVAGRTKKWRKAKVLAAAGAAVTAAAGIAVARTRKKKRRWLS